MTEPPATPPAPGPTPLERRRADLDALTRETWDVVIVGGGIVGSGALLDAVSRGMRAALIEQDDIGAGTSSRSSRLIHGGLRYLEQFHFGLVREALAERSRLLAIAPHLVRIEPLLFPIYGIPFASTMFYDAGLTLYDMLGARRDGGWHRRLSKAATLELAPTLRPEGLHGGLLYSDGVEDDARYTLAVARTAQAAGGVAVTRVRATGLRTDGTFGVIQAVDAEDLMTGAALRIPTRAIVDATGVWAAQLDHPFRGRSLSILPSRGAHLVVPRERIPNQTGLTIRVPGRVVFLVPWPDHWLIGTTDAPYDGPPDHPSAAGWEVDRLLDTVNATMDVDLTRDDVVGTYAGLRPLIAPSDGQTVKASREHRVTVESNGVVRIGGGKYTTYRLMARDAIDTVLGPRRRSVEATRPNAGSSGRPTPTPWHGSPASCRRSRPSAISGRRRRHDWSPATGRTRRAWSRSARSWACCGRWSPAVSSSRPRWRGPFAMSWLSRSTTSWRAGPGWPRSCPTAARPSLPASRRSSAPSSAGAHHASGSRWTRTSRRLGASIRSRLRVRPGRPPARCRPRWTDGARGTSSARHGVGGIIRRWSPWPTCSARSSTVCTRTASRSRSGRWSSRSWSS